MMEMTVNDMKQLLLSISEETAQQLLLSIPNEHINKERVMKTYKYIGLSVKDNLTQPV